VKRRLSGIQHRNFGFKLDQDFGNSVTAPHSSLSLLIRTPILPIVDVLIGKAVLKWAGILNNKLLSSLPNWFSRPLTRRNPNLTNHKSILIHTRENKAGIHFLACRSKLITFPWDDSTITNYQWSNIQTNQLEIHYKIISGFHS